MTDKQIIIDVSKCEHYEDLSCFAYRDSCGYPLDCKDHPNCYYKQLKRAEQKLAKIEEYCKPKVMMNGTANVILQIIEGKDNG